MADRIAVPEKSLSLDQEVSVEDVCWEVHSLSDFRLYLLGISAEETNRYRRFLRRGSRFRNMSEFRAVLRLSDSVVERIHPQLRFPDKTHLQAPRFIEAAFRYDLNNGKASDFAKISGIGPVLSKRIVNYRRALGGFVSKDQLFEVYGLDSTIVNRALERFELTVPVHVRRINIQSATEEELRRHPYISARQARRIILFRELEEMPLKEGDLRVLLDVSNKKFNRIRLYLQF